MAKRVVSRERAPMVPSRTREIPAGTENNIAPSELIELIDKVSPRLSQTINEEAAQICGAINACAHMGLSEHVFASDRRNLRNAVEVLREFLTEIGYPMDDNLAQLDQALQRAMPALEGYSHKPRGQPFWVAALNVHPLVCYVCIKGGLSAGMTRGSVAVRITAQILSRLGFNTSPAALELFFQKFNVTSEYMNKAIQQAIS